MIGNLPYGKKKTYIIIITKVVGNSGIRAFLGLLVLIRGLERTVKE